MRRVKQEDTFAYAVAYTLQSYKFINFRLDGKPRIYQYITVVYDPREDGRGCNTVAVCYDYRAQKYVAFNIDDEQVGNKRFERLYL